MPVTHVPTTVQIFIVVVSAATAVATTLQKFIVVVSAATALATTLQKFIVRKEGITFRCFKSPKNWICIS